MSNFQVSLNKDCKKFENVDGSFDFKTFRNNVYKKFSLYAADFYFIDKHNIFHLVESENEFIRILANKNRENKFYVNQNVQGSDNMANLKYDTRNLKINNEYEDQKNDKKPRNYLVQLKKQKAIVNKNLKELCQGKKRCSVGCQCDANKEIMSLENVLRIQKRFLKNRLVKKFWKSSDKQGHQNKKDILAF
jgi:hypothetical protein